MESFIEDYMEVYPTLDSNFQQLKITLVLLLNEYMMDVTELEQISMRIEMSMFKIRRVMNKIDFNMFESKLFLYLNSFLPIMENENKFEQCYNIKEFQTQYQLKNYIN